MIGGAPGPAPESGPSADVSPEQADATIRSKQYVVAQLIVVSIIGVAVSLAAWCFLEAIHQIQQELYTHLPHAVGYSDGPPKSWPLPILAIGALVVALAITRLPGRGRHIPAEGLSAGGPSGPRVLPGVILAGLDDRLRARARSGGSADRDRRRLGGADDQPRASRHPARRH